MELHFFEQSFFDKCVYDQRQSPAHQDVGVVPAEAGGNQGHVPEGDGAVGGLGGRLIRFLRQNFPKSFVRKASVCGKKKKKTDICCFCFHRKYFFTSASEAADFESLTGDDQQY